MNPSSIKLVVSKKTVDSARARVRELETELARSEEEKLKAAQEVSKLLSERVEMEAKLKATEEKAAEVREAEKNIQAARVDSVLEFRASDSFQGEIKTA